MKKNANKTLCCVSVIIAVKNNADTLVRCINSFQEQTLNSKELIVIDGKSKDGTVDIINSYTDIISYSISIADTGIAQAWNRGLDKAQGDWIIFLGADDYFYHEKALENFHSFLVENPNNSARIVYGKLQLILPNGKLLHKIGEQWQQIQNKFFTEKMLIPHPACFHHHSVFRDENYFDDSFKIALDYEFLLRILKNESPLFIDDFTVTYMTFGGVSSQASNLGNILQEETLALRKHGFKARGIKRYLNLIVYKIINVIAKVAGENSANYLLDIIRYLSGKPTVWTRK